MKRMLLYIPLLLLASVCLMSGPAAAQAASNDAEPLVVGPLPEGGYAIPSWQLMHPAGSSMNFDGRPVDIILSPDGSTAYAKNMFDVVVMDAASWQIRQRLPFPTGKTATSTYKIGSSPSGMAITRDGKQLFVTTAQNHIYEILVASDGKVALGKTLELPGPPPSSHAGQGACGLTLSPDDRTLYVCLTRNNTLGVVDVASGAIKKEIPVGVAPFAVVLSPDGSRAYVSNWAGRHPKEGEQTGISCGTPVVVDKRGVVISGTVSVVDLAASAETAQIEVGLHPSGLALSSDGGTLYVANANSDTVSIIDTGAAIVTGTFSVRPEEKLPFGSEPNALALSRDGKTLFVANGGNNAVAVVALPESTGGQPVVKGFIPTAWHPGALAVDETNLYIANIKGMGMRFFFRGIAKAYGPDCDGSLGTVSKVKIPSDFLLRGYTLQVLKDTRAPQILAAMERKGASNTKPVPVPARLGDPSVFEHVVYVIKENKTYDQLLSDIPRGNRDPSLLQYTRDIIPNTHALAEEFALLDNYYCSGITSAEGHTWVAQGNVTDYYERFMGGWTRSYGDDNLVYSSSGSIWDNILDNGLSLKNYGEDGGTPMPEGADWASLYRDFVNGRKTWDFKTVTMNERLRAYSHPGYPGWNMKIPDVIRADIFLQDLAEFEKGDFWPNLVIVYLPNDHTTGGRPGAPIPFSQVADNDLALGRVVEAITKSKFWSKTCIFVEEDDPQSGFDHVDGHRSICLVISPYTRREALVSDFYNQASVLHTMERMLGLPPMNQMDAMAPLMTACFTDKPDFTPYTCRPNEFPLDTMPLASANYYGKGMVAEDVDPFSAPDIINDDQFNRILWELTKGKDLPYPAHFAGAHGTGLAQLGLTLSDAGVYEDDD